MYCGLSCTHVSVDLNVLADRLSSLATDPDLRARLGAAGKARAREMFDWAVVYRRYEDLWRELDKIRAWPRRRHPRQLRAARIPSLRLATTRRRRSYRRPKCHGAQARVRKAMRPSRSMRYSATRRACCRRMNGWRGWLRCWSRGRSRWRRSPGKQAHTSLRRSAQSLCWRRWDWLIYRPVDVRQFVINDKPKPSMT